MPSHPPDRRPDGRWRRTGPVARSQGRGNRARGQPRSPESRQRGRVRIWVRATLVGRGGRRGAEPRRDWQTPPRAARGRLRRQRHPLRPSRRQAGRRTTADECGLWARSGPVRCPSSPRPASARAWRPDRPPARGRNPSGARLLAGHGSAADAPRAHGREAATEAAAGRIPAAAGRAAPACTHAGARRLACERRCAIEGSAGRSGGGAQGGPMMRAGSPARSPDRPAAATKLEGA